MIGSFTRDGWNLSNYSLVSDDSLYGVPEPDGPGDNVAAAITNPGFMSTPYVGSIVVDLIETWPNVNRAKWQTKAS